MIELFLSMSLSCPEATNIINRMEQQREALGNRVVDELIHEIKNYSPECYARSEHN